jgi:selenocysteine-specific elongation factor
MYVIGTAGHVDHGKSTLVQALTGIDPDRLREEKERGLTIDLGFAWLVLPSGEEVSIVDVPGHERFIKNMLAGVGGIDLALLVIAADEGVMPQTREHLAIIDLLGISHGVVAMTKADLVDADLLELARADVEDVLAGTTLEGSPIIACSGVTRLGLDDLLAAVSGQLAQTPLRRDIGRPRLPIDRIFTMTGFGTVVTGTLIDGSLAAGQDVELLPGPLRSRIRGLQSHGKKVQVAPPGRRTAVNLTGLAVDDLRRGLVVTTPGWLRPTDAVDVRLRAVSYLTRPVRHNLEVTFHTGAAEVEGRLLLLDTDEVRRGETAWAQVRLSEPVAAIKGDRFIIRDPNDTLGGGRIIDTHVRRHRRFHGPTIAALEQLEKGSPEELVRAAVARAEPVELREVLKLVALDRASAQAAIGHLIEGSELLALDGNAPVEGSLLITAAGLEALTQRMRETVAAYHRTSPLRRGMAPQELRNRLGLAARPFEQALALWTARGDASDTGGAVALPGHNASPNAAQQARAGAFLAALEANPFSPAPDSPIEDDLLAYLEDQRQIVRVGDGVAFSTAAYDEMTGRIVSHLREHKSITLAEVRDMFATSRKFAQALLEHMDGQHITRRTGDTRVLR